MDVPTSLKTKWKSKIERRIKGIINTKLDSMIHWMQETGPVLKEFDDEWATRPKLSTEHVWSKRS